MEFEKVRGQIESLWNEGLTEAGVRARRSGEAAGVERVFQAAEVLIGETLATAAPLTGKGFLAELRRRLSLPEPVVLEERLTFSEWEERARLAGWVHALDKGPELPPEPRLPERLVPLAAPEPMPEVARDFREGDEERRVLVDRRGGEVLQPEIAPDFEEERARQLAAEDAAQVFPPPEPLARPAPDQEEDLAERSAL